MTSNGWVFNIACNQYERWVDGKVVETVTMIQLHANKPRKGRY